MKRSAVAFFRALTIAIILLASLGIQSSFQVAAADALTVNRDEATSDFPNGIEFRFDVEAPRKIKRIELLYQTADLETLSLSVPEFKPGKHVEFTHLLDFRLNYQPSGVDITYRWRVTDDRDTVIETEPKTLLWGDNRFDWQTVSSPHVTVYAYNQNEAFNRIILDSAQSTVDRLAEEFGITAVT